MNDIRETYVGWGWWRERPIKDVLANPVPWMAKDAIKKLDSLCTRQMHVMEHGGGGSTLWLAKRVKHVTTYEANWDWVAALNDCAPPNITVYLGDTPPPGKHLCDMLIVDGSRTMRGEWIAAAPRIIKPGGILVVDNFGRPEYAKEYRAATEYAVKVEEVDSNVMLVAGSKNPLDRSLYFHTAFLWMPDGA